MFLQQNSSKEGIMHAKELTIKLNDSGEIKEVLIDGKPPKEMDVPNHNVGEALGIIWKDTCVYDPIRKKWYC